MKGEDFTFIPNKKIPIYSWFYYKEGFSRNLVLELIKGHKRVLDPFCGSGTTLLAAKEVGLESYGFDVMPICVFASRVKTRNYDIEKLKNTMKIVFGKKFVRMKIPKLTKWFSRYTLEDVVFFKSVLNEIDDKTTREFFKLALINATMKCSYVFKDGSVLKVRKKNVPPLRFMFRRVVQRMIKDLEKMNLTKVEAHVDFGDARMLKIDTKVDVIVTSPPYLNKIEYKNVYRIENELFFSDVPKPPIRSYFGLREGKEFPIREIIGDYDDNVLAYFQDIYESLKEMYRVLEKGGKAHIVIGDGLSGEKVIDVLENVKILSEDVGFTHLKTLVGNERVATTPQRRKVGILREGLVSLIKD